MTHRVLAVVAAHPDDDVMGVAGLIARYRADSDLRSAPTSCWRSVRTASLATPTA